MESTLKQRERKHLSVIRTTLLLSLLYFCSFSLHLLKIDRYYRGVTKSLRHNDSILIIVSLIYMSIIGTHKLRIYILFDFYYFAKIHKCIRFKIGQ